MLTWSPFSNLTSEIFNWCHSLTVIWHVIFSYLSLCICLPWDSESLLYDWWAATVICWDDVCLIILIGVIRYWIFQTSWFKFKNPQLQLLSIWSNESWCYQFLWWVNVALILGQRNYNNHREYEEVRINKDKCQYLDILVVLNEIKCQVSFLEVWEFSLGDCYLSNLKKD